MRLLPSLGSRRADASIADTEPAGAPSSATPSAPSVRPRRALTWGMCAAHEANSSPFAKNTAAVAAIGHRMAARLRSLAFASGASPTPHPHPGGPHRVHCVARCGRVSDDQVSRSGLADHKSYAAALYETLHRLDAQSLDWIAV